MRKTLPGEVRLHPRREGRREARRPEHRHPRQPVPARATWCRAASSPSSARASPRTFTKGSGRLELADVIVRQPIAMRVIVNRIWKGHFGTGIVDTPSNFGKNGERPTQPGAARVPRAVVRRSQALDQGAAPRDHAERGLSASSSRRRSRQPTSTRTRATGSTGARNASRHDRRTDSRLGAVRLRRARREDGRAVGRAHADWRIAGRSTAGSAAYKLDDFLQLFDFPSPSQSAEKRFSTNVPLQRLFFMNSDFMQQHAERLAERVIAASRPTTRASRRRID